MLQCTMESGMIEAVREIRVPRGRDSLKTQEVKMQDEMARQARDVLTAVTKSEVPAEVQAFAQESVAKARDAYTKWNAGAEKGAKALEELIHLAQSSAKSVGEQALGNVHANTDAAFDAAGQLARARTLQEAVQLQAKFVQTKMGIAGAQGKALFELTLKIAKEVADGLIAIAASTAGDFKKSIA
jgi:phasin